MEWIKLKLILGGVIILALGVALGGVLFHQTIPRTFMSVSSCQEGCFDSSEMFGLLASIGIQNLGGLLPTVIYETDKTLVFDIQYPYPPTKIHYLIVPKKDIKDIAEFSDQDKEYLADSYAVMGKIVRDNSYEKYFVTTNGSGSQDVAYLHFHLVIDRDQK